MSIELQLIGDGLSVALDSVTKYLIGLANGEQTQDYANRLKWVPAYAYMLDGALMEAIDRFDTMAELAITLAGFSGLMVAFKSRDSLNQEDLRRIVYIVGLSFAVVVTAILPAGLSAFNVSLDQAIRASSLILGLTLLSLVFNGLLSWRRARISPHFPKATVVVFGTVLLTSGLLLFSVANLLIPSSPGLLLLGQLVALMIAGWIFLSTIIWASSNEKENDATVDLEKSQRE